MKMCKRTHLPVVAAGFLLMGYLGLLQTGCGPAPTTGNPSGTPPAKDATPLAKDVTPPGKDATPPAKDVTPPGKDATPPAKDVTPPGTTPPNKNHFDTKADLEVTAEELGKEFTADRDAANKKYKDKKVRVTGKVESTKVDDSGTGITLKTGGTAPLSCGVRGYLKSEVKALKEGQEVTVQGILLQWSPGNAFLKTKDEISISGCELGQ